MTAARAGGAGVALAALAAVARAQVPDAGIPHLRRQGTATQLVVDGAPFLVLGGELGNSTASSAAEMRPIWPKLRALHLNTVIAPVYWELVEPAEGRFEFASVDSLIGDARANGMRLVLLWFGTWKNSMSTYPPAYVKTNQARYPRTESTRGTGQEILAPYAAATREVDARAFRALMRHLRLVDGTRHTVLMVQVENEVGMIPTARDHSALADSLYAGPVPAALTAYLEAHREHLAPELRARWRARGGRTAGSWEEVFGPGPATEELFMAWHFARFTEAVTAAGKAEYPLPMYANAALIRPGYEPGRYVSAGPLPHLIDVWRAAAPSLDLIAPDIYFPNFAEWTGRYVRSGNPLFVPEAILNPQAAVNALYAFGRHDAIGFSPFAIEAADPTAVPLAESYALLAQLAPVILAHQGRGTMTGVLPPVAFDGVVNDSAQVLRLGDYTFTVTFQTPSRGATPAPAGAPPGASPGAPPGASMPGGVPIFFNATGAPAGVGTGGAPGAGAGIQARTGGGIVVALAPNEFLIAGSGLTVTFASNVPGAPSAGILRAQEGHYAGGRWVGGRWLNGDQTHQGRHIRLGAESFGVQRVTLYPYR